jgi:membrane-associated phospholipid phosphatase
MIGHAYTASAVPARPRVRPPERSRPASALGVAGLCVAALALVWAVAEHVTAAQLRDAAALRDFTMLSRPSIDRPANFLVHLLEPRLFILWGIALVALALARERPRVAVAVTAVMALAPLTSEKLKPLLAHEHLQAGAVHIGAASWPSGHSTAALALVLSAVLVAPARLRPLVASVGALYAAAVGCALLILAWHMPSDVLGGYLVAIFWTALAVAALRAADQRWPHQPTPPAASP